MILSQNAKDSHQLWEEELKSRSKLGLRLFQLDKEKNDLSDQVVKQKKFRQLHVFTYFCSIIHIFL